VRPSDPGCAYIKPRSLHCAAGAWKTSAEKKPAAPIGMTERRPIAAVVEGMRDGGVELRFQRDKKLGGSPKLLMIAFRQNQTGQHARMS
jgi:hypothetical protein